MHIIIKYKLIREHEADDLTRAVSSSMEEGWKPYGSPCTHIGYIVQAMVMYADTDEDY